MQDFYVTFSASGLEFKEVLGTFAPLSSERFL